MRSELDEVCLIDYWLLGRLTEAEARSFEARLLLDDALAEKVAAQRTAHRMLRQYGRRRERSRLEAIYRQLLGEADFSHQLHTIFT